MVFSEEFCAEGSYWGLTVPSVLDSVPGWAWLGWIDWALASL